MTNQKIEVPASYLHFSRLHIPLAWVSGLLLVTLVAHAILKTDRAWPAAYFNLHEDLTIVATLSAVFIWCTNRLIREVRKARKKNGVDLRAAFQEALDEGHIVGLASGFADLASSSMNPRDN